LLQFVSAFQSTPSSHHNNNNNNNNHLHRWHKSRLFLSDIPRDNTDGKTSSSTSSSSSSSTTKQRPAQTQTPPSPPPHELVLNVIRKYLPPPPEDQFILMGDLGVLWLYAFTSHSINDWVVSSTLSKNAENPIVALHALTPPDTVPQLPVWATTTDPSVVNHVWTVQAHSLLNHWGPLFATEGLAFVSLSVSWLLAGWISRAFLFQNSIDCSTQKALTKTLETWTLTALLMTGWAMATNTVLGHYVPEVSTWLGCTLTTPASSFNSLVLLGISPTSLLFSSTTNAMATDLVAATTSNTAAMVTMPTTLWLSLTKDDVLFIVDSMSVLVAWRFMANRMLNMFR
jgi:hypothetical protein